MEEKHTSKIINRFLFNLKEESSERLQQHEDMPGPCKTTTNEATWTLWKQKFPDAKFSSYKIGVRMYYMIS